MGLSGAAQREPVSKGGTEEGGTHRLYVEYRRQGSSNRSHDGKPGGGDPSRIERHLGLGENIKRKRPVPALVRMHRIVGSGMVGVERSREPDEPSLCSWREVYGKKAQNIRVRYHAGRILRRPACMGVRAENAASKIRSGRGEEAWGG